MPTGYYLPSSTYIWLPQWPTWPDFACPPTIYDVTDRLHGPQPIMMLMGNLCPPMHAMSYRPTHVVLPYWKTLSRPRAMLTYDALIHVMTYDPLPLWLMWTKCMRLLLGQCCRTYMMDQDRILRSPTPMWSYLLTDQPTCWLTTYVIVMSFMILHTVLYRPYLFPWEVVYTDPTTIEDPNHLQHPATLRVFGWHFATTDAHWSCWCLMESV